MIAICLYSALM